MAQRVVFLLLIGCLSSVYLHAQEKKQKPEWSYGANTYYGGVLRYKPEMPQLKMTDLYGVELYANKITNGHKAWQSLYNFPQVGFSAEYYNYGQPKELGEVFSLSTYLDFTASPTKKTQLRANIGTGLVYSSKTFNAETNPNNKAVSSTLSYILRGTIHYEIQLNRNYYLNLNAAFRHYSNGKLNMPNNGMNFPVIGAGVRYVPNPEKIIYYRDTTGNFSKKLRFNLTASTAWREVWEEDYKHRAYSLSLYGSKQITKFNAILLGVDGFLYDKESVKRALFVWRDKNNISESVPADLDGRQVAITVGTELFLGKMSVLVQGGFYVYKPQEFYESTWYQRYGLKYYVIKNAYTQITLKSHSRTADMVEFGIGISL